MLLATTVLLNKASTNPEETKDKFYEVLDSLIASAKSEKFIILGDFLVRVGKDDHVWHRVLGKHGIGKSKSKGLLLLRICASPPEQDILDAPTL